MAATISYAKVVKKQTEDEISTKEEIHSEPQTNLKQTASKPDVNEKDPSFKEVKKVK